VSARVDRRRPRVPAFRSGRLAASVAALAAAALLPFAGQGAAAAARRYYPAPCGVVAGPRWRFLDGSGTSWLVQATIPCRPARRLAIAYLGRVGPELAAPPGWRCDGQAYAGACFRITRRAVAVVDWTADDMLAG